MSDGQTFPCSTGAVIGPRSGPPLKSVNLPVTLQFLAGAIPAHKGNASSQI